MSEPEDRNRQLVKDFRQVFVSSAGANVLENLAIQCSESDTTYERDDFGQTAFNEGKRWVMLYIRGKIAEDVFKERQEIAED